MYWTPGVVKATSKDQSPASSATTLPMTLLPATICTSVPGLPVPTMRTLSPTST
jgi:hypothetical protein